MPVQVYETPNPNARKFVLSGVRFEKPANYSSAAAAAGAPLAARLFQVDGVYNVFMAQDFVTVNKLPGFLWEAVEQPVLAVLGAECEDV